MKESELSEFEVGEFHHKKRLDVYLVSQMPGVSRARLKALIERGLVQVNAEKGEPSQKVRTGDKVSMELPAPSDGDLKAQDIPLDIIYDDEDLLIINKSADMVVHPGAGNPDGTIVNALLHLYPDIHVGEEKRPGIVHRLDKDTSGVMICAKNDFAHQALSEAFKYRDVEKTYLAFCCGQLKEEEFELLTGHRRHAANRKRFTTKLRAPMKEGGGVRRAHSKFLVLGFDEGVTLVQVDLLSGRTHQIRAHLADIGHPILGDSLYGGAKRMQNLKESPVKEASLALTRQALHASKITFTHPRTEERLTFEAPLPADLQKVKDAMVLD